MFSIVLLSLVATIVTGVPVEELKSADYDHYVFTQVYPAGSCYSYFLQGKGYECNFPSNASTWTIHGLWPTEGDTRGPNFCDTEATFNPNTIMPLVPQLVSKWTNILNHTGFFDFWKHEYLKHGTCSGLSEYNFFSKVLDIYNQLAPLGNVFQNAGVVPDNKRGYSVDKLGTALSAQFGVSPVLQCTTSKGGVQILDQIELCLSMDWKPMVCPDSTDSCSGDDVLYPQYSPSGY
ncbi:ribonuclease Oy-like [Halichondria panicea]|uniref:ribonuclease Oy-like n=1 Tax=Halichondria panicea TaxID=6063 RepID=UPI00312B6AC5